MPVIDGVKFACEPCMRGHRSSKCTHGDRILIRVRKPGRPLSSCPHEMGSCSCEVTRVAIPKVSSCKCGSPSKSAEAGEGTKRRKVIGQALNAERKASLQTSKTEPDTQSVIDPNLESNGCSAASSDVSQPVSSSCCKPKLSARSNGVRYPAAHGSSDVVKDEGTPNGNYASNGEPQSSVECKSGLGGPSYIPNHPQISAFAKPQMLRGPSAPGWDVKHSTVTEFHIPGSSVSYPRERYGSRDETDDGMTSSTGIGSIFLPGGDQTGGAQQMTSRLPFQFSQPQIAQGYPVMQQTNYFPSHVENVQFLNTRVGTPGEQHGGQHAQSGFFSREYNPAPAPAGHECHCGPSCNCLGCATHPFNKKTLDYVRSMREALGAMSYPGSEDVDSSSSRISSPHILPHSGLHISSPTGSTFKENNTHHDMGPPVIPEVDDEYTISRRESMAQPTQTSDEALAAPATEFFHIDYRLGCCSEGSNCHCGKGCTCVGCLTHGGHNGVNLSPESISQVLNGARFDNT